MRKQAQPRQTCAPWHRESLSTILYPFPDDGYEAAAVVWYVRATEGRSTDDLCARTAPSASLHKDVPRPGDRSGGGMAHGRACPAASIADTGRGAGTDPGRRELPPGGGAAAGSAAEERQHRRS